MLLISKVKTEAQIWDKIYINWLWKLHSVKLVAKRFLFDAYCDPVCLFKEINCICVKFLRVLKPSRLKFQTLEV